MDGEATDKEDEASEGTEFCRDCGAEMDENKVTCPECGARQSAVDDESEGSKWGTLFVYAGVVLGFFAIIVLPIVFGPLAVICGLLARVYGRPTAGSWVIAWGFIAAFTGWILGIIFLTM